MLVNELGRFSVLVSPTCMVTFSDMAMAVLAVSMAIIKAIKPLMKEAHVVFE